MSYLVAAYAVAIAGIALYAGWLARTRRSLVRELSRDGVPRRRAQKAVDSRAGRAV